MNESAVPTRFRAVIEAAVERLVAKDYVGLSRDGLVSPSYAGDHTSIGYWIEEYPASLVPLPHEAWDLADAGEAVEPGVWWVVVPLWTAEEGRSDLSLEATIRDTDPPSLQIDGVHVL